MLMNTCSWTVFANPIQTRTRMFVNMANWDPVSRILGTGSWIEEPWSWVQDPGSSAHDARSNGQYVELCWFHWPPLMLRGSLGLWFPLASLLSFIGFIVVIGLIAFVNVCYSHCLGGPIGIQKQTRGKTTEPLHVKKCIIWHYIRKRCSECVDIHVWRYPMLKSVNF